MAMRDVRVVSVPVSDPDRAKSFYVDKLGLHLEREDTSIPDFHWIQVIPEGGTTALTLVTWFDTMPAGSLQGLVLTCDDLQTDYELLVNRGVTFDSPPQKQPWGTEAILRDPDGNRIVLQQA